MDLFHQRLARVALEAAAEYGFCLAGGYAVQAHGFVDRVSKDVDLFTTMELGVDWRAYPPVQLAIGPVLHPADAVANKLCALFGRAEVRDYIDVHGVLEDGRFTTGELLRMAAEHDPGFDPSMFVDALRAVRRFPSSAFEPYKLTADQVDALHARLLAWADEVEAAGQ